MYWVIYGVLCDRGTLLRVLHKNKNFILPLNTAN